MADPNALDPGDLAAPFAQLPAALKALQDRAVAEAVAQSAALLRDHHALYHRTGPAGLSLVETQALTDDTVDRIHFTTIPPDGTGLLLVIAAHQKDDAGSGGLLLRLNDDATLNYSMKVHEVYGTSYPVTHQVVGDDASFVQLGRLSIADGVADPANTSAGIVAVLPGHGVAGRRKQVLSLGSAFTQVSHHFLGQYGGEWRGTAAITKLSLIPSGTSAVFGAGSVFSLYRLA